MRNDNQYISHVLIDKAVNYVIAKSRWARLDA